MRVRHIAVALVSLFAVTALAGVRPVPLAEQKAAPVVNINTATETELMYLPGIGAVLAGRIVEYRGGVDRGGPLHFTAVDELLVVKGIKAAKLDVMRPFIALEGRTTAKAKIHVVRSKR